MVRLKDLEMVDTKVAGIVEDIVVATDGVEGIAEDIMEDPVEDITENLIIMVDIEVEAVGGIHGFLSCITYILLHNITIMMNIQ
jgi:hypothetical protein